MHDLENCHLKAGFRSGRASLSTHCAGRAAPRCCLVQSRAVARFVGICALLAWTFTGLAQAEKKKEGARLLFLGNSITLHGPAKNIGWTGNWGMAASAEEKDYVHLVVDAVTKRDGRKPEAKVVNLADFERGFEHFEIAAKLKAEVAFRPDTVILALGENVRELKTDEARMKFRDSVSQLLKFLKGGTRCTIYVRSCFWPNAAKDSALKEACATVGGKFVDISALAKDERNYARSERKIAHSGVAAHPGDKGMSTIANLIFAAISAPSGLRVAGGGNSWYAENCAPYAKELGIQGHQFLRTIHQNARRAPGDTRQTPLELAEKGEIDVFVWGHTDGFGGADSSKSKMLLDVLEAGLKKNANFKLYIQVPWLVHDGRNPAPADIDYGESDLAEVQAKLDARRKVEEAAADATNARFGKRVVFLVPMSDAMMGLRRMIAAGKFPGVTNHSAVFAGDHMPHASALGAGLGELCHFAAIYRMSPEGLPKTAAMNRLGALDENQLKILQKLAWETVSNYPHAGIAKAEAKADAAADQSGGDRP